MPLQQYTGFTTVFPARQPRHRSNLPKNILTIVEYVINYIANTKVIQ